MFLTFKIPCCSVVCDCTVHEKCTVRLWGTCWEELLSIVRETVDIFKLPVVCFSVVLFKQIKFRRRGRTDFMYCCFNLNCQYVIVNSSRCKSTQILWYLAPKNVDHGPLFEQLWLPRRDDRIDEKISRTRVEILECQMLIMYLPSHAGTKIRDRAVKPLQGDPPRSP